MTPLAQLFVALGCLVLLAKITGKPLLIICGVLTFLGAVTPLLCILLFIFIS